MKTRRLAIWFALGLLTAFGGDARADEKAGAQAAFDLGKKLMIEGKFAEACPKLEESLRIEPGVGTMLFLGECYERTDRSASAWAEFREAEALAARLEDPREKLARERADALEPTLAKLTLVVPPALKQIEGMRVSRDGHEVGRGLFDTSLPVDPGAHHVAVTAPGRRAWSRDLTVAPHDGNARLELPAALDVGSPPGAAPDRAGAPSAAAAGRDARPQGEERPATQKWLGVGVAAAGLVGIGVGTVFGLQAGSKLSESNSNGHCTGNLCDPTGTAARNDASSAATASTAAFVIGGVALAAGLVLYLTAPKRTASTAAMSSGWPVRF